MGGIGAAAAARLAWRAGVDACPAPWEPTVGELKEALASGELTARALVERYLARIEALNLQGPALRAVIETNPDALAIADALDRERRETGPRGPLHGIPILLKDNIDTADRMLTTAGSLALVGDPPSQDATVARRLRDAGAVLLGKANLSEWSNFRSSHPRNGWSARGGQTRCPYVLDADPCGSSSGSAVATAVNMCAAALGTETDGSITCPAGMNGVVGLKPTVGLVSRAGVIPISHTQDSVGPMTRSVTDAAILLGVLAGVDPRDPASAKGEGKAHADYTRFLDPDGLKGARIGLPRGRGSGALRTATRALEAAGARLVGPAALAETSEMGAAEHEVMLWEFKAGLNAYLATRSGVPVRTLAEAIAFNEARAEAEMPLFGQETFLAAQAKGDLDDAEYRAALETSLSSRAAIDQVMDRLELDALVIPGQGWGPSARAGYPVISVPAGLQRSGVPANLIFAGRAYSEPVLLRLAYAFERATQARRPPGFLPTAAPETAPRKRGA